MVLKVLPQEQVTASSLYSGWMVGFISCFSCRSDQPAVVTGSVKRAIILDSSGFCNQRTSATHRVEELAIVLGRLDLVEQEFHRFEIVHVVEQFAQHPHLLQDVGLEQQFFAARA